LGIGLRELQNKEGGSEAELVHAEKEEATREAEDVMMTKIATTAATETGTETETGAMATYN